VDRAVRPLFALSSPPLSLASSFQSLPLGRRWEVTPTFLIFFLNLKLLTPQPGHPSKSNPENVTVERLTRTDRASAGAAAAAHDINDEMTIILNSTWASLRLLEPGHPARLLLYDLSAAAQRCVWKTSAMLDFSTRHGVYPLCAPVEHLTHDSD